VEVIDVFRWPDEDPARRHTWTVLRHDARRRLAGVGQILLGAFEFRQTRGRLATWTRNRPGPLALVLTGGLASAAWALQNIGSGLSVSLARMTDPANTPSLVSPMPGTEAASATLTVVREAQWGDPLPTLTSVGKTDLSLATPALPPATPKRHAGTVVLASQYYGIAPYEPTPSQRGNLIAVLAAQPQPLGTSPPAAELEVGNSVVTAQPVLATPTAPRENARARLASLTPQTPSALHLAQFGEWIGLAESLPLGDNSIAARTGDPSLTMPQAVELGRMQQRHLLEQRTGHRADSRRLPSTDPAALLAKPMQDPGYQAAQVFLEALQARLNHALALRHERQVSRVVAQARTAWTENGQAHAARLAVANQALRQVRTRLAESRATQQKQVERLTPLIGTVPQALSWGTASELGLPSMSRQQVAGSAANRWAGDHQQANQALLDAFARHETFERRTESVRGLLLAHAQVAGALHAQLLQGRRELPEVIQAYERLHLSRLAVASLALEELHSQLQVAHATGRLLLPLTTASQQATTTAASWTPKR